MRVKLDPRRFGPSALVTGASSGLGREFARQIAASGINVALVARRETMLIEVGQEIAINFQVDYRVFAVDLSRETSLDDLIFAREG